jgi:hypothetical protein
MRPRSIVALGSAIGVLGAVAAYIGEQSSLAGGANAAGVGFGISHLLFFLALPWSLGVLLVMWIVGGITHSDGPAFLRPFFFAMPIVAGTGWGCLIAIIADYSAIRRASRPAE